MMPKHCSLYAFTRLPLLICLSIMLTSCAWTGHYLATEYPSSPLDYYAWLQSADDAALARESRRLSGPQDDDDPVIVVQQVLLQEVTGNLPGGETSGNPERLRTLLASGERDLASREQQYLAFAEIWLALADARQALLSAQAAGNAQVRALNLQVRQLEQQIEALTTIEQRLVEREQIQNQQ